MATSGDATQDLRWDAIQGKFVPEPITAEPHTIGPIPGQPGKYGIRLIEMPLKSSDPTTTTVPANSVTISGYTEVSTGSPGATEFLVDYHSDDGAIPYRTSLIYFDSSQNGVAVNVAYYGAGASNRAQNIEDIANNTATTIVNTGLASIPYVNARNSVLSGPINSASNKAEFLADSGGLSVDVLGATTPIRIAFANGYDDQGAVDYVGEESSDQTITGLASSSTNYILARYNTGTGAISYYSSTRQPSYASIKPFEHEFSSETSGFGADTIFGAVYAPGLDLWCIVGSSGKISTSPDGSTWTSRTSGTSSLLYDVCWSESLTLFVAVGASGTLLTSPDGITWTSRTSGFSTTTIRRVIWVESLTLFVAVGESGKISTSPDGTTWTSRTSGVAVTLRDIDFSSSLTLLCVAGESNTILTSPDGTTWTSRTAAISGSNSNSSVAWSPDLSVFVMAGAHSGAVFQYSSDGVSWTEADNPLPDTGEKSRLIWNDTFKLFVTCSGSYNLSFSRDGLHWQIADDEFLGGSTTPQALAFSEELDQYIGAGASGVLYTGATKDGLRWFDRQTMKMWHLQDGYGSWVNRIEVPIGEATTDGSGVTSVLSYGYMANPWVYGFGQIVAWLVFDGKNTVRIIESENIAGITDVDVGRYSVVFEHDLPHENYVIVSTGFHEVGSALGSFFVRSGTKSKSGFDINTYNSSASPSDLSYISLAVVLR